MENFLNFITFFFTSFITIKFLFYIFKYKNEIEITKEFNDDIRFLSIDSICFSIMSVGWVTKLLMVFGINNYISL